jgi:hypothetical protein
MKCILVTQFYNFLYSKPAFYPMGTRGSFSGDEAAGGVKLTTHLHLVPKSRMRGSIPPLPTTPSWRGAQLKNRDNLTLIYIQNINSFYY